ncbi:LETM1-related biofilm-associated protein [Pricia sp.]|uniref:LETM1-related biofilm-associated protein n=1 Tax=Pricia sp. TaxID=2268138 RepID=UPI00359458F0
MNPSASGWIDKFGSLIIRDVDLYANFDALYGALKKTGFIYGINTAIPDFIAPEHSLSEDEKAKINLLNSLYITFSLTSREPDFGHFLTRVFQFYKDLKVSHSSFLNKILTGRKTSAQLEKLIDSRVYLADNVLSKTFNRIITNSLLCIDVLLFKRYLSNPEDIRKHAESLEYLSINITYHALSSKEKSKSDERLADLFAASLSFIDSDAENYDGTYREKLWDERSVYENQYLLDIACMTVWEDKSLDYRESEFIFGLGKSLGFDDGHIAISMKQTMVFFRKNADVIPFLKDTNAAVQFYDSMAKVVDKLILRNSKRLQKELSESKELVFLLSKSTVKDLTVEEKKKVQNQLMDVFKSIPSLAIFILPGGAVLLPIFIKLIPKLLPSSFDENRIEK